MLRNPSLNPRFDLAGRKLATPYVVGSLMCPLTPPPPRSSTPPNLSLASESFEDVPNGLPTGMPASKTFEDASQGHGKYDFLLLKNVKSYMFLQEQGNFC